MCGFQDRSLRPASSDDAFHGGSRGSRFDFDNVAERGISNELSQIGSRVCALSGVLLVYVENDGMPLVSEGLSEVDEGK
jgi:hypothetical protein